MYDLSVLRSDVVNLERAFRPADLAFVARLAAAFRIEDGLVKFDLRTRSLGAGTRPTKSTTSRWVVAPTTNTRPNETSVGNTWRSLGSVGVWVRRAGCRGVHSENRVGLVNWT